MFLTVILVIASVVESLGIYLLPCLLVGFFKGFWWLFLILCWLPILLFPFIYILNFGLFLGFAFILGLFINTKKEVKKPSAFARFLVSQVVKQINFLARIKLKTSGFNLMQHERPYTIVYNHTSRFDPMLIMDKFSHDKIVCVTKPENKKIPIAGPFIHKAGYISVNRENTAEGIKAIEKAVESRKQYSEKLKELFLAYK